MLLLTYLLTLSWTKQDDLRIDPVWACA